jgi:DNA-binding NarL/FixJ family response regulator
MRTIKVLLGEIPPELRHALPALLDGQEDVKTVGESSDPIELLLMVQRTKADVVILHARSDGSDPGVCSHLAEEFPRLLILIISPNRIRAWRWAISKQDTHECSERLLLDLIHSVF